MDWNKVQEWEIEWWGDCINTYGEEEKQLVYAQKMGLRWFHNGKSPYNIDLEGKRVVDIGGGASSLLLKCVNRGVSCWVIDPILKHTPRWIQQRYIDSNIIPLGVKGEDIDKMLPFSVYDEVWIYNVLQHTEIPGKIIRNAKRKSKIIRIFEWIDTPINDGHPHALSEKSLNEWLDGEGKTEVFNHYTLQGKAYYGIFPTPLYTP